MQLALGRHQEHVGITHEREVGVHEAFFLTGLTIAGAVEELHEGISVGEFADVVDALLLGSRVEELAGVGVGEFLVELGGHAKTAPAGGNADFLGIHLTAGRGEDDVVGDTVAGGVHTVLLDGEDDFVGAQVVVGEEQFLIGRVLAAHGSLVQGVTVVHEVLEDIGAVLPAFRTGIDTGIQIELCEEELGSAHAHMAFRHIVLAGKVALLDDVLQLTLKPGEEVGAGNLLGSRAHHVGFCQERNVAEAVDGMVVCEGAHGTGLVDETVQKSGVGVDEPSLADELVGHGDLHEDAGIERIDESIVGGPVHPVEVLDGLVIPAADALVGRQLAVVIETTDILGGTAVKTGD